MGLADRLVNAGWPKTLPSPDQLSYLDSGFGTEVYAVPGVLVVRLARTVEAGKGLAREGILLRLLSGRLPVETPLPIWSANACDDVPHGALALSWVGGVTPVGAGDAPDVSDLVGFLVALHGLPLSVVEPVALPAGVDLAARRRSDAAVAREVVRRRWSSREVDSFERWLEALLSTLAHRDTAVVVHGDFWYGNLRVAGGRLRAVLDWEEAAVNDPAVDLGPILYLGSDTFDAAVREYAGHLGVDYRVLSERARASCEARELSGIRACVAANDEREIESELLKLRAHL